MKFFLTILLFIPSLLFAHECYNHAKVVTLTAYSPRVVETDNDPRVTASMQPVREGIVAVSRDLFYDGWTFGQKVYIEGYGVFEIQDLMNKRFKDRIDIFHENTQKALDFGKKKAFAALIGG